MGVPVHEKDIVVTYRDNTKQGNAPSNGDSQSMMLLMKGMRFALICLLLASVSSGQDATAEKVRIGEKWMSYEEAMPILLQKLDGNNEQKSRAAELLQAYGNTLIGTPAFKRLIEIVDEKVDFSAIDPKIRSYLEKKAAPTDLTPHEEDLAQCSDIKAEALMALVMSGSKEGAERIEKMLASKSPTERFIAQEVKKERDSAGSWQRGKVPTKPPVARFSFGTKQLEQSEFLEKLSQAFDSKNPKELTVALQALWQGGYVAVLEADGGNELMVKALTSSAEVAKTDGAIREARERSAKAALTYIDSLPPEKAQAALPFIAAAASDSNSTIAERAGILLQYLRTHH